MKHTTNGFLLWVHEKAINPLLLVLTLHQTFTTCYTLIRCLNLYDFAIPPSLIIFM